MRNLLLFAVLLLILSSCNDHSVSMKSVGTSMGNKGDITVFFEHKDKTSYAIRESFSKKKEDSKSERKKYYSEKMDLLITSKDRKSIESITLNTVTGSERKDLVSLSRLLLDGTAHSIEVDSFLFTHRKWHMLKFIDRVTSPEYGELYLYDVSESPTAAGVSRMAFTEAQKDYAIFHSLSGGFHVDYANTTNTTSFPSSAPYNSQNIFYYISPSVGSQYNLVYNISTFHMHHFLFDRVISNPQLIVEIFTP